MIGEGNWGDGLRARIAAAGLNQSSLASKIKVTKARVGELCSRDAPPRVATVLRLAEALGCDPADLDPRLAAKSLPLPGSRIHNAAKILERKFKLRVEYVAHSGGHYLVCRRPKEKEPAALVSGPNKGDHLLDMPQAVWGCLAPGKLQVKILAALNGHA